jgi:replicative superfamily II helicase
MVPGYKFSPKFKAGIWDGKIRLYNLSTKLLPIGLLKSLMRLLSSNNIQFSVDKELSPFSGLDLSEIDKFIQGLNLHARGVPVEAKNYQIAAVKEALKNKKKLLLSPTSSGKSMILYIYIRYQIDVLGNDVVLIVPTTQLVEQMYEDFKDYSSGNEWPVDEISCRIYAGKEKLLDRRLVISTWASIVSIMKRDRKSTEVILNKTGALCCDDIIYSN